MKMNCGCEPEFINYVSGIFGSVEVKTGCDTVHYVTGTSAILGAIFIAGWVFIMMFLFWRN
jgi:hypothetical protein